MGIPEGEASKEEIEEIFEVILAKNFPKLMRDKWIYMPYSKIGTLSIFNMSAFPNLIYRQSNLRKNFVFIKLTCGL